MTIYNNGLNSFVWKGTRYGLGTIVKFKDEFYKTFRWNDEMISSGGYFDSMYIENGKKIFQFQRYCLEEWCDEDKYVMYFSLTELELFKAIELIHNPVVPIEEITASAPPFAEKHLALEHTKKCKFFVRDDCYYGSGSKMYITDGFMDYYQYKTGKRLTKKITFLHSQVENGNRKYWIACCNDMKEKYFNDYVFIDSLTEEEFFMAIEFVTDCHTIKYKDTDEPTIFIFWILAILIIAFSFIIFVDPSGIILIVLIGFWRIRKTLLRQ